MQIVGKCRNCGEYDFTINADGTIRCERCGRTAEIKTLETFRYADAKPGDLVDADVVMSAMNALPPVSMRKACAQLGEPYSHWKDPDTGKLRPVYATFRRVEGDWAEGTWEFQGYCFLGETEERGREPIYVGL